jgi:hypothetical protein
MNQDIIVPLLFMPFRLKMFRSEYKEKKSTFWMWDVAIIRLVLRKNGSHSGITMALIEKTT